MFLPTKYEDLHKSNIVLGADIISRLKLKAYNIEDLFQDLNQTKNGVSLSQYHNALTFLWLVEIIELNGFDLKLKK